MPEVSNFASSTNLPEDEYLSMEQLRSLHALLDAQLHHLLQQSRDKVGELTEAREIDADAIDLAVTESNRDFTLRMADRERRLLVKIKHSLARMQQAEYGACESCGSPISFKRLLARPVATFCIDCKTEFEQLEGRKSAF